MKQILLLFLLMFSIDASSQVDTLDRKAVIPERHFFTGTSVSIIPPAHFKLSDKVNGFIHDGAATTLLIDIKDKPYHILTEAVIDEEKLAKQGVKLLSKETLNTNAGFSATLLHVSFEVKSKDGKAFEFERLMLITGNEKQTVTVVANFPVMAKKILFEVLKQSILTVEF
jgi:hypothetical protein